jgi:uncharacterized protein (DUF433 family)
MAKVRRALAGLGRLSLDLFEEGRPTVAVTSWGEIVVNVEALPLLRAEDGQYVECDLVNLIGPFEGLEGMKGPDLAWPRPTVQIVPRKISGAPHIAGTRVPTQSIFALARRGLTVDQIARIYPFLTPQGLGDSIDLEEQLKTNISLKRAA